MSEKKYHHGDLKHALIDAAVEILREGGYTALSLRACAARVGVSHAAPKNHFPAFADLLTTVATNGFERHAEAMRRAMSNAPPDINMRALAVAEAYVDFAMQEPDLFRLMFAGERLDFKDPALNAAMKGSFGVLLEIANREERAQNSEEQTTGLIAARWSIVHGFAMLAINGQLSRIEQVTGQKPTVRQMLIAQYLSSEQSAS